jgi:hypothetical protein
LDTTIEGFSWPVKIIQKIGFLDDLDWLLQEVLANQQLLAF